MSYPLRFFVIAIFWLGFLAKKLYKKELGQLMRTRTKWVAALIFCAVFIGGLMFFLINPALEKSSIIYALLTGALFGFITYASYEMTNLATLQAWPLKITIIDMVWGTTLNVLTASIGFYRIKLIGN